MEKGYKVTNGTRMAIYTALVWAGALIISLIVAEWREPDLSQIENDLREIKAAPVVIEGDGVGTRSFVPATPVPGPTVELKEGAEVEYEGAHYKVTQVRPGRIEFILEGPHPGAQAYSTTAVDEEGFVCVAGAAASPGVPLLEGQKALFWIQYSCREGEKVKSIQYTGITFEAR